MIQLSDGVNSVGYAWPPPCLLHFIILEWKWQLETLSSHIRQQQTLKPDLCFCAGVRDGGWWVCGQSHPETATGCWGARERGGEVSTLCVLTCTQLEYTAGLCRFWVFTGALLLSVVVLDLAWGFDV